MNPSESLPKFDALMMPTIEALKTLGGSASNEELADAIAEKLGLTDAQRAVLSKNKSTPEFEYRLAWARTYLKHYGAVRNSQRGVWSLTETGERLSEADVEEIKRNARANINSRHGRDGASRSERDADPEADVRGRLLDVLKTLKPHEFEKLCQQLLRESGFINVRVTGRSNDGGIDGEGVYRVNLLSFRVLFQCKRWKGSVGPNVVRDFRGAMSGRVDKGLIITTGTFTAEARREASRDGPQTIELINGDDLCRLLIENNLGVVVKQVKVIEIDDAFFRSI
ncbi:restriction endonuclease [Microvirga sp. WGZ8]|uniref:Restriction endonuclease n=2 Tax=Microvirga puerhi TaxID=2876078 RepID=A0ABS7VRH6_9HYPH|nr:restriction endonuclease [Microvirga puerhi]